MKGGQREGGLPSRKDPPHAARKRVLFVGPHYLAARLGEIPRGSNVGILSVAS
jgi:hypothetical protein